jgi:small subunit ribosomal protein S17
MTETSNNQAKSSRKRLKGVVVSNKMKDTVVVMVERFVEHPKYKKYLKVSKRYKADDKGNTCEMGKKVEIEECAPISKTKHFIVVK